MISPQRVWQKVKRDQVLNLSELAVASGYDRGVLSRMCLPLQFGKISLADFKRVMRKREDVYEERRSAAVFMFNTTTPATPPPSESALGDHSMSRVADKFDAPSSKRAKRAASLSAQAIPLGNTA